MKTTKPRRSKKQARASGGGLQDKIQAYFTIHAYALFFSLGRMMHAPLTSAMTVAVLAVAISLAGGFYLLVCNLQQLTGGIEASNQISVFLKTEISDRQGVALARRLNDILEIQQVRLISKQQALQEFKSNSGFGEALNALHKNPLPVVIQVLPENKIRKQQIQTLLGKLQEYPEVDFAQMDMQWVERLRAMMQLARRGVGLISFLLGIAVLFITGNTIRLELQNRRDEVMVAKLVGATHSFIQRPFLYSGFWYGFAAGLLAWLIITVMMLVLRKPVEKLSALYDGGFTMLFMGLQDSLWLLAISSLLGVVGAWMVLISQLQQIKPE